MKTYTDYEQDYEKAISAAKSGDFVVKKDVWISAKWEADTGFLPFSPTAQQRLKELEKADKKLYHAVVNGMIQFLGIVFQE